MSWWPLSCQLLCRGYCRHISPVGCNTVASITCLYVGEIYKIFNVTDHHTFFNNQVNLSFKNIIYYKVLSDRDYYAHWNDWDNRIIKYYKNQEHVWITKCKFNSFNDLIISDKIISILIDEKQFYWNLYGIKHDYPPPCIISQVYTLENMFYVVDIKNESFRYVGMWIKFQKYVKKIQLQSHNGFKYVHVLYLNRVLVTYNDKSYCVKRVMEYDFVFENIKSSLNNVYGQELHYLQGICDNKNGVNNAILNQHKMKIYSVGYLHVIFQTLNNDWFSFGNNTNYQCLHYLKKENCSITKIDLKFKKYKIIKYVACNYDSIIFYS